MRLEDIAESFDQVMIGSMALTPQTVDHVNIPVIATGGIMDGRGVLSALMLGAEGVKMGTAFVTSVESGAKKQHKKALLNSTEEQVIVTSAYSGKPTRGIQNDFIEKMARYEKELPGYPIQNTLTQSIRSEAAKQNKPEWMSLWCGQNPRSIQEQTAGEMVAKILSQVDDLIEHTINVWR